jgi:uncharacterized protein YgiM (DUF1202 family)
MFMKKLLFIITPFVVVILIFSGIIFFLSQNKGKGALQVTSVPSSKVYLNNKLLGQTPLCECDLKTMIATGDYTVKLVPVEGNLQPFEQAITISSKVLTVVDRTFGPQGLGSGSIISLTPIADKKDAQIATISFPDTTEVFLDSNLEGQTPLLLKNITESDHELKLTKEGYKDKIIRIRTVLGYKLDSLIFLGIDQNAATSSAMQTASSSATVLSVAKILILQTPTGFLRVRDQASLSGAEIGQVKPGETYTLLDVQTGWYKIKINDKEGWISSQYSQKQ